MEFIHKREYLERGDLVVLEIDTSCRFMIMEDASLNAMKRGSRYQYIGGHVSEATNEIIVPRSGYWNIVIDTGGDTRNIRYTVNVLSSMMA